MDSSRYKENQLTSIVNEFLEDRSCRGWTEFMIRLSEIYNTKSIISKESTRKKNKKKS